MNHQCPGRWITMPGNFKIICCCHPDTFGRNLWQNTPLQKGEHSEPCCPTEVQWRNETFAVECFKAKTHRKWRQVTCPLPALAIPGEKRIKTLALLGHSHHSFSIHHVCFVWMTVTWRCALSLSNGSNLDANLTNMC
jgi:hypothetical protein